jgi:hypothetical protein
MFDIFDFDLPGAVTEQLEQRLQSMRSSTLTEQALRDLARFQEEHKLRHGVYQLLLKDEIVYVGKATDARERLEQHYWKLKGRQKIRMADVRFRCLVLPRNWSPSANEDLLIAHYKAKGQCRWNGFGFGPKDVGQKRDETEPSGFDREYPINADYPCKEVPDQVTVGDLTRILKRQLPFTFRYEISQADRAVPLNLAGVPRTARALIAAIVKALGPDWQATIFFSHIILYKEHRAYPHGQILRSAG